MNLDDPEVHRPVPLSADVATSRRTGSDSVINIPQDIPVRAMRI